MLSIVLPPMYSDVNYMHYLEGFFKVVVFFEEHAIVDDDLRGGDP